MTKNVSRYGAELIKLGQGFLEVEFALSLKSMILKYRTDFEDFPLVGCFKIKI